MNLRTFFTIASVVALVYAVGLLLMPAFMGNTYGLGSSPSQDLIGRFFGVTLLGLGLVTWFGRDLTGPGARAIITGSLVADTVGLIVALIGTLGGVMSTAGWSAVVIYFLLALGFAYFQFMAPAK